MTIYIAIIKRILTLIAKGVFLVCLAKIVLDGYWYVPFLVVTVGIVLVVLWDRIVSKRAL